MEEQKPILKMTMIVLFTVSMVTLGLEILLTRIFAVVLFTSHSFMAISLALLGTGSGAIIAYLGKPLSVEKFRTRQLVALAVMAGLIVVSIFVLLQVEFVPLEVKDPDTGAIQKNLSYNKRNKIMEQHPDIFPFWKLYTVLPLTFLPFLLAGYIQAIIFRSNPGKFGKLYGIDLIGATVGSLTIPLLLYPIGLLGTIFVMALITILPIIYTFIAITRSKKLVIAAVTPLLIFLVLMVSGSFRVKHAAGFSEKDLIRDYWTPFARVSLQTYRNRHMYVIDNSSRTYYVPKNQRSIRNYSNTLYSVAMQMKKGKNAMIIASGGGQEIAMASHFGMKRIDAIEIAGPIIRDIVNKRKDDKNNPYLLPEVTYHIADGRSVSMRAKEKYDLIQMLEVNCWTQAGQIAQAWSPYFVFTQEAFAEYFNIMKKDGYLCYTVFSRSNNPVGGAKGRRFRSVIAGMRLAGIKNPEKNIVILERPYVYGNRAMVIAKPSPFTEKELVAMREIMSKTSPRAEVFYPDLKPIAAKNEITIFGDKPLQGTTKFIKRIGRMIDETQPTRGLFDTMRTVNYGKKPINDDRPYLTGSGMRKDSPRNEKFIGDLYKTLLKVMGILIVIFVILPFIIRRPGGGEKVRIDPRLLLILACTGVGFMFIEMAGIYKFQLYLHHPTLAMIMVLSSMILGAGLGSLHSARMAESKTERGIAVYAAISVIGTLLLLVLVPIAGHRLMLVLPMPLLMMIVFSLFTLLGFFLGHIVPLSIETFAKNQKNLLAWCWAITVTCSVVGTVLASILAREYGMFLVALLGICAYTLVVLVVTVGMLIGRLFKKQPAEQTQSE